MTKRSCEKSLTFVSQGSKDSVTPGLAKAIELGRRSDPQLPTRRWLSRSPMAVEDYTGGMVKDEVLAMLMEDRIPIYALGFYRPPLSAEKQRYLDVLGEFARRSGGDYWQMNSTPIVQAYSNVRRRILQSYVVSVACPEQVMDGSVTHLRLNLTQEEKSLVTELTSGWSRLPPEPALSVVPRENGLSL